MNPRSGHADRVPSNALTIDLEEYFQVSGFADAIHTECWAQIPSRIELQTEALLKLLDETGTRATFFVLGWLAQRHPALIRRIVAAGHELASHGWAHVRVRDQTPQAFQQDARQTRELLEEIGGVPVIGYRAASFSIGRDTPWAFEALAKAGYRYSSSVYPIRHDHYGWPDAPRLAFRPASAGVLEIPIATVPFLTGTLPCGGGGYFRLFPYAVSRWGVRRFNREDRAPAVFYLHAWELDPEQPIPAGISTKARLRHRINLKGTQRKLRRLLTDFRWDRIDCVFSELTASTAPGLARVS